MSPVGRARMLIPQGSTLTKPSEAAQAGKCWLLVGSTEELLCLSLFLPSSQALLS